MGSRTLAEYTYSNDADRQLLSLDCGNGDKVQYTYDSQGRVTKETYEDGDSVTYTYNSRNRRKGNRIISYSYDAWGNLLSTEVHVAKDDANYAKCQSIANFNPLHYWGYVYDAEVRFLDQQQILSCALDIGEQMLISGAEVSRVELTISMICKAYGCRRSDVFIITSSMILTVEDQQGNHATQTRRITGTATDLAKLHQLNALSRRICAETPCYGDVQRQLQVICSEPPYSLWLQLLVSGLIAFAFTVFFGGSWMDGGVAAILGMGLRILIRLLQKAAANQIIVNVVASFLLSAGAILLVRCGLGQDVNKILIGNIMLLIPGIALTNALRDLIGGDIMTGLLRFLDAVLVAAAIAAGYILAAQLLGGGVL